MSTAQAINGEIKPGDYVFVKADEDYGLLVGQVKSIAKTRMPEHDAGSETDDIHVNFKALNYPPWHQMEIEENLNITFGYGEYKSYHELPLDDVILASDALISLKGISDKLLNALVVGYAAETFGQVALRDYPINLAEKVTWLIERLNDNRDAYYNSMKARSQEEIISEAGMIAAVYDAHFYLTENHIFDDSEADYLLLFEDPLEIVAEKWCDRTAQLDDFQFALNEVFDKKAALLGGYKLYKESITPKPSIETPVDIKQAARHEAERLLQELKSLQYPNHPDNIRFAAEISPEYIKMAGGCYGSELIAAFRPSLPITFGYGQDESKFLVMTDEMRANVQVIKPSIREQLRESIGKAAEHNALASPDKQKRRDGAVL